jgi:Na+-transporting methylmalonyl-CoA/oxaloacetate decarboxylase gamma subunit
MQLLLWVLLISGIILVFPYYLYLLSLMYHMGRVKAIGEVLKKEIKEGYLNEKKEN